MPSLYAHISWSPLHSHAQGLHVTDVFFTRVTGLCAASIVLDWCQWGREHRGCGGQMPQYFCPRAPVRLHYILNMQIRCEEGRKGREGKEEGEWGGRGRRMG